MLYILILWSLSSSNIVNMTFMFTINLSTCEYKLYVDKDLFFITILRNYPKNLRIVFIPIVGTKVIIVI